MPKKDFPPEKTVDREVERDVFAKLLRFKDEKRLLVIQGGEGTGKTTLLGRLQYDSEWIHELPSVLVSLELETIGTPFELIDAIKSGLSRPPFDPQFDLYDALNKMRASKQVQALAAFTGAIQDRVNTQGAQIEGKGHIERLSLEPGDWTSELEQLVREECVKAFFADLKSIADEQPVVVLLDSYDKRCNSDLQRWILSSFVRPLCFDEGRPKKLVVVLAGRPGEGMPDFGQLAGGEYKPFITSIRSLAQWTEEHVRAVLELHGYGDLNDEDVDAIWTLVQGGRSIGQILLVAEQLGRGATPTSSDRGNPSAEQHEM
jgi:hypothetical protein